MPNIKSAKKRVLVNKTKAQRNKSANSALKTAIKKANVAIEANAADKEAKAKEAKSNRQKASTPMEEAEKQAEKERTQKAVDYISESLASIRTNLDLSVDEDLGRVVVKIVDPETKEVLKHTSHDPSLVVIDETVGQLLSFLFVSPFLYQSLGCQSVILYVCGFALFRLFDITKPSLVGWADEKIHNAHGVMLDDVFAGLFAGVILFLIAWMIC